MDTQTLSLDQTYDSLHWISDRAPRLHVQRILFHIPRRNDGDFGWNARLKPARLKFECRLVDAERQTVLGSTTGELVLGALITPLTMQPMFDIGKHWRFEAPRLDKHHGAKAHWETHLWLEGFELRDAECATVFVTMNAQLLVELAA